MVTKGADLNADSTDIEVMLAEDEKSPELQKLDRHFRKRILEGLAKDYETNPYSVLDLQVGSPLEAVRKRYHELSQELHPDRHFKKELGPYKKRLESLFSHIQKAYARLKDPFDKEALDKTLQMKQATPKTRPSRTRPNEVSFVIHKPQISKNMKRELESFAKSEAAYKKGLESEKNKHFFEAYTHFVEALKWEPKRDLYKAAHQRIQSLAFQERTQKQIKELKNEVSAMGISMTAYRSAESLMKQDPENSDIKIIFARAIVEKKIEERYHEALALLQRIKSARPKDAEISFWLARLYENQDNKKSALKEAKEALEKNPHYAPAHKLLERLK